MAGLDSKNTDKRLSLQYAYLRLEKEDIEESCSSVELDMRDFLLEHFPEHYDIFYGPPAESSEVMVEPEEHEGPPPIAEDEEESTAIPKNKDIKKLFRKVAEKTHPDKVGSDIHADLFSKASNAYKNNDLAYLIEIAGILNLEIVDLSPEARALIRQNIEDIAKEIAGKKSTTAWAWINSETQEDKETIIKNILKHKGVEI